jgi:hypothetical protein
MNPLFFLGLTFSACAVTHYSVLFLEPTKASWMKALTIGVFLVVGSNIARWSGFNPVPMLEWIVYIVVTGGFVGALYKLRPMNSFTVGACYVAGSYVLAYAAHINAGSFNS